MRLIITIFVMVVALNVKGQKIFTANNSNFEPNLPDPVMLLKQYVSIPSESGKERQAGVFLKEKCIQFGLYVEEFRSEGNGMNFAASLYPLDQQKPNIVFLNHIDVVPAGDTAYWDSDPYKAVLKKGKIYGRGAIDNKSLGIIHLIAVSYYVLEAKSRNLPFNVTLLSVSGEETGGIKGSKIVADEFYELLNPTIVIGEGGTGLESVKIIDYDKPVFGITVAEKSILWLKLEVNSATNGHASLNVGEYANKVLVSGLDNLLHMRAEIQFNPASKMMFREIGELAGGFKGFVFKHFNWRIFRPLIKSQLKKEIELASLITNSITLSSFQNSDGFVNQNAQRSVAFLDCRLLPGNSTQEMIKRIKKALKDTTIRIQVIHEGPYSSITYPETFFDLMSESIKTIYPTASVVPMLFPASSDNNYFREKGCPVYGINPHLLHPEQIKSIHNANENIDARELKLGIEVFKVFIAKVLAEKLSPAESQEFLSRHSVVSKVDDFILTTE